MDRVNGTNLLFLASHVEFFLPIMRIDRMSRVLRMLYIGEKLFKQTHLDHCIMQRK